MFEGEPRASTSRFSWRFVIRPIHRGRSDRLDGERGARHHGARQRDGPGLDGLAVAGFLLLQGLWRRALFVTVATFGGWFINGALKELFQRPRPDIVPHLREVMTMSFPSGHAMQSAVVYLTLGALSMHIAQRRLSKFYCMSVAMLATALVGASRVYLGVHYPTDVLAGWLIGLSWALLCWIIERSLERQTGLKRERAEAEANARAEHSKGS